MKSAKVIFGTSSLGNLYCEPAFATKQAIVEQVVRHNPELAMFDSAGKYGAGLALECLGQSLANLGIAREKIRISNKLGWQRVPLKTAEPTFEPGVWVNLRHDAVQTISYQGILDCYHQGNELLGDYHADTVSVHDPDEFLAASHSEAELNRRRRDILDAYRALDELKARGEVDSIGVGAKDIAVIDFISDHVQLDWAMPACAVTPYSHRPEALQLLDKLARQGVSVINSAVFNAGFLIGGDYFDYRKISPQSDPQIFSWRERFIRVCEAHQVDPAAACVQFSFLFAAIKAVALNTSSPQRIKSNMQLVETTIPQDFWNDLRAAGLIKV